MEPSKEAIEAALKAGVHLSNPTQKMGCKLKAAYAIDFAALQEVEVRDKQIYALIARCSDWYPKKEIEMIPKQRLIDFIFPMCCCPCCEGVEKCDPECTRAQDNPADYQRMFDAREVLYPRSARFSYSIVEGEAAP